MILKHHIQSSLKNNKNLLALVRHAERQPIEKGTFGEKIPLTPQGEKTAKQLGKNIADCPIHAIHTSPVHRCIHTTEKLIQGSGQNTLGPVQK